MSERVNDSNLRRSKYPWDEWTDGGEWVIYQGDDYDLTTRNMQISLHRRASSHGLTLTTRSFRYPNTTYPGLIDEGLRFRFAEDNT